MSRSHDFSAGLWPLALAVLFGALLRFYHLGANSLWIDEFATLDLASHSVAKIVQLSSGANFIPPLYFLLVHGALQIFGESETTLRLLSAVAGICTIPLVWLLTREITTESSTATIAAALLAISPLHLWYSQEARPYALLLFFGCCSLWSLQRAARTNSVRYWLLFSLSSSLAFLTHTTGVIFGLTGWVWLAGATGERHRFRPLVASSLGAVIICTPAIVAIVLAFAETGGAFHTTPRSLTGLEIPYSLLTYIGGYSFGPSPREIQDFGTLAALRNNWFQTAIAALALLGVIILSWRHRTSATKPFLSLFGVSLLGILILSGLSGKPYNVRYTLPSLLGFVGALSVAVRALHPTFRALVLTGLAALALTADAQWFWVPRYWKEDSRAAATWLASRLPAGASVAVAPSYSISSLRYYAGKAGADLHMTPASGKAGRDPIDGPDALVLTRLHHVPNWRELRAQFLRHTGTRVAEGEVEGYMLLIRANSKVTNLTP